MQRLQPHTEPELCELIRERIPLDIEGFGSKHGLGHPRRAERVVSTRSLCGILSYEPDEMVISARAGTPLEEISHALSRHRQRLAFEPPDWKVLYGHDRQQSIGGVVACNLSGSRRLTAGACRDHVLGFKGVNGLGEPFQSGGRVVKNVTGYDLSKLMTGAHGTLGVLTELTLRTVPVTETETTLVVPDLAATEATRLFATLLGGPWEVASAAWLPAAPAVALTGTDTTCALLRLEGLKASVDHRLNTLLAEHALSGTRLDDSASITLWQSIANAAPFHADHEHALWRISVPPAEGASLLEALGGNGWLDWAGGLIWLKVPDTGDADAETIRAFTAKTGGHATLVRASESTRTRVAVFEPAPAARARLEERIRSGFDPDTLLNPGRMHK